MDNRASTPQTGRPFDAADMPRREAPVVESGFEASAAQGSARETRVTEPSVATDGQIVEAGYGHGV
jgi:hypothetical protein